MAERRERNAGFTLVELLIAVTILAIIAVPLMHAFVSSARTNAQARKMAQANTAAWNVMEEIKAKPISDILDEGSGHTELPEGGESGYRIYEYDYGKVSSTEFDFTAKVELMPGSYTGEGSWSDEIYQNDEVTDYNRTELPQIYDMNPVNNASYLLSEGEDEAMAGRFAGNRETVLRGMERIVFVDIRKEDEKTLVEIHTTYTWNGITKDVTPYKQCIYSNEVDETEADAGIETNLQNVYFFFSPMTYPGADKEHIIIRNQNQLPVNVYLIRQGTAPDASTGYRVAVNVLEQGRTAESYAPEGTLDVRTHLRTNLFDKSETGVTDGVYADMKLKYGTRDGDYTWELTPTSGGALRRYTAAELTDLTDLAAEAAADRIYNVTVTICEEDEDGNKTEVAIVHGTKEK